tara:strand:+ start:7811 stop:8008 length:198 start_codon:yes stop_codon:yes gene_type:complete
MKHRPKNQRLAASQVQPTGREPIKRIVSLLARQAAQDFYATQETQRLIDNNNRPDSIHHTDREEK